MQDFQQRVVDEKAVLDEKIRNLADWMETDRFQGLPEAERTRMNRQLDFMCSYSGVLGERIAAFT